MPTPTINTSHELGRRIITAAGNRWWGYTLTTLTPEEAAENASFKATPNEQLYTIRADVVGESGWYLDNNGDITDATESGGRFAWFKPSIDHVAEHGGLIATHRRIDSVHTFTPCGDTPGGWSLYHHCIVSYGNIEMTRMWAVHPHQDSPIHLAWSYGGRIGQPDALLTPDCPRTTLDRVIDLACTNVHNIVDRRLLESELRDQFLDTDCTLRDAWGLLGEHVDPYAAETFEAIGI